MSTRIFRGQVQAGRFVLEDRAAFATLKASLEGKPIELTLRRLRMTRSGRQNRYLHGVVFAMIAEAAGYTLEEAKDALKWEFLRVHSDTALPTVRGTSTLDTAEMTEFIEQCRILAASMYGINIPDPNEVE